MSDKITAYLTQSTETVTSTFTQNGETLVASYVQAARGAKGEDGSRVESSTGGNGSADGGKVAEYSSYGNLTAGTMLTSNPAYVCFQCANIGPNFAASPGSGFLILGNSAGAFGVLLANNLTEERHFQLPDRSCTLGDASWGGITGTLSAQTDLNTALGLKVPTTRTIGGVDLSSNRSVSEIGATPAAIKKTSDFTAVAGNTYICNGAITVTDPATAAVDDIYACLVVGGLVTIGGVVYVQSTISKYRRCTNATGPVFATLPPQFTDLLTLAGGLTTSGAVTFGIGTTFGAMGTGVAALFRAALGSGTVGDALFLAATQASAQTALGVMGRSKSRAVLIEHEFCGVSTFSLTPFVTTGISSGTLANGLGITPNHPGVCIIKDSATANGGYVFRLDSVSSASLLLGGGERFVLVFQINSNRSTQTVRVGFHNAVTITAPTNGVYIELIGNGSTGAVATGKATNAGGTGSTGSTFTCLTDTWYSLKIELNSNATGATFTIYNEAGASVWSDTVGSTYIPTAAGRFTDVGIIATESTTDAAANMISIDYVLCDINRDLVR